MENYNIKHLQNQNRFIITNELDNQIGKLKYDADPSNNFVIISTEIDPKYAHHGLGTQLVQEALDYAKQNEFHVTSTCEFADRFI
ncbi:GNAT family N-acetyltransferase [Alkalibaculum sp. M08DMB]|uniref:GNAT family N-acetyltransferase n=1 Tax=Alkalibaculum sporogenes TaxID=2655001 RepID=A0A6A7KCS7_9FIRM|nr:GNAT family N-acetyltransferase [Alkalibaculum sporogenes]MPW27152.1 GNAT family N-acetyltransferase [Alkalibaculum sporogenes]